MSNVFVKVDEKFKVMHKYRVVRINTEGRMCDMIIGVIFRERKVHLLSVYGILVIVFLLMFVASY